MKCGARFSLNASAASRASSLGLSMANKSSSRSRPCFSSRSSALRAARLTDSVAAGGNHVSPNTLREFKESAERKFLVEKLRENGWNISKTAEVIGTPRSNLYKKLEQYAITQESDG